MSKAFTKEDADVPEAPTRHLGIPLPQGVPNYVTAAGERAARAEHDALAAGPRDESAEDRYRELSEHLATAAIVESPADRTCVGFGASVTVEDDGGARTTYRLVGAIEAVPREGAISWQSPIARALMEARVGDTVILPRGEAEVIAIHHEEAGTHES